jgi:hypothetical protein
MLAGAYTELAEGGGGYSGVAGWLVQLQCL